MQTLLIAVIYLAFVSLGLPDSLLGSGWPAMHASLDVDVSLMGVISIVISASTVLSSLLSERLARHFSTLAITCASVFLSAASLFGFSVASSFPMLVVLAIPYGLSAGAIDATLNSYVAKHFASRFMSWLHCFWGVGALASPFVMGYALATSTWSAGYRAIGFVQLGIGVLLILTARAWRSGSTQTQTESTEHVGVLGVLRVPGVKLLMIGFFCYCSLESTAMWWSSTYFAEAKGFSAEDAAMLASLFYIGMTAGRFVAGFAADKMGDRRMILLGTVILAIGIGLLALPVGGTWLAIVGYLVVGIGCAPIYPSIIHSVPSSFGGAASNAVIGTLMASAYVGNTLIPPLYGALGGEIGFGMLPFFVLVFAVAMIASVEGAFRKAARS